MSRPAAYGFERFTTRRYRPNPYRVAFWRSFHDIKNHGTARPETRGKLQLLGDL
jgi:hypothetical protein